MASTGGYKYTRLDDVDIEGPSNSTSSAPAGAAALLLKQEQIIREQDDDLELIGKSASTLKHMSYRIGEELNDQSELLDELGADMERVDTKLDGVMKKMAKLAHLDDETRQCKAIVVLSVILFFLVFLFIVL